MLSVNPKNRSPFLAGLTSLELPIRHGEGRLFIKEKYIAEAIVEQGLNCLTYRINPNGSHLDCAGLTDGTGRILGLMPHPEAYLSIYNHPDWNRRRKESHQEEGEGIMLFKNIIQYIQTK
jgi:phosphoribosylformylglycinamidine synthase